MSWSLPSYAGYVSYYAGIVTFQPPLCQELCRHNQRKPNGEALRWSRYTITYLYVTTFEKTYIVHTSHFAHLEINKSHSELYTDLKLSGVINSSSTIPESFTSLCHSRFYESPNLNIGRVSYACFPISGHIYI